jgi:hypothetical protein
MLKIELVIQRDIQKRRRFTVMVIRQLAGFEFKCLVLRQESYFRHTFIMPNRLKWSAFAATRPLDRSY